MHHNSALFASASFPNYVVFHELVHTSKAFMRHATSVKYDWLESYLKRVSDVDLKRLSAGRIKYHANRWKRESDYEPKLNTALKNSCHTNDQKNGTISTSNTPSLSIEDKVAAAKARFLARKKK